MTGASHPAGRACLQALRRGAPPGAAVLAATRGAPRDDGGGGGGGGIGASERVFDLEWPESWAPALAGVTALFLLPPARLSRAAGVAPDARCCGLAAPPPPRCAARRVYAPLLAAARAAGVRHVVVLSVAGAGRHAWLPHARIERAARASGLAWTFVRPAMFMQALARAPLRTAVRGHGLIELPAGSAEFTWAGAVWVLGEGYLCRTSYGGLLLLQLPRRRVT